MRHVGILLSATCCLAIGVQAHAAEATAPSFSRAPARILPPSRPTAQQGLLPGRSAAMEEAATLPLLPPLPRSTQDENASRPKANAGGPVLATVLGSLGIVLSTFFLFAWMTRRSAPHRMALLPGEVVESLGRAPLAGRQQMQLIRLGNKLVLLGVTPDGAQALAEVTEAAEVERLLGLCQQQRPGSVSEGFRQILMQAGQGGRGERLSDRPPR